MNCDLDRGPTKSCNNGGCITARPLPPPCLQSAILGMHNITQRAMVVNGTIQPRPMMYIALTYDHRLIDGREVSTAAPSSAVTLSRVGSPVRPWSQPVSAPRFQACPCQFAWCMRLRPTSPRLLLLPPLHVDLHPAPPASPCPALPACCPAPPACWCCLNPAAPLGCDLLEAHQGDRGGPAPPAAGRVKFTPRISTAQLLLLCVQGWCSQTAIAASSCVVAGCGLLVVARLAAQSCAAALAVAGSNKPGWKVGAHPIQLPAACFQGSQAGLHCGFGVLTFGAYQ